MAEEKKSIAGLVLGILSLILWLIPLIGLPIAIIGLIFGIIGVKDKRKFAMAALICSIIGLVLVIANASIGAYMGATGQHAIVNQMMQ